MQSKRNKIVLAVICCVIAVFAIVFITQAVNKKSDASQADTTAKITQSQTASQTQNASQTTETAKSTWESKPFGSLNAVIKMEVKDNGFVYLTMTSPDNKVSGEFFYPTEKLSDTTYNDLLYMTFDCTDTENYSAELLPYDCEYVLINGEKFDAVKGSILVDGKAVEFNILVEANKRSENTKMIAVDKNGNKHEVNQ